MAAEAGRPRAPIRRLAPDLVARIAAGEVVERPASVVKELVENALDAGARAVTVSLDGGGLDRIQVEDDGVGIPADELELAVERHATSKLAPESGWESIRTLGFRGEALAAIGSVARLRIVSRPAADPEAHGLAVDAGRLGERFMAGRAPGTTVEVRDLFYATPARRKFLRSPAGERLEVLAAVERLYLARPDVSFGVVADGAELARYPAASNLSDAAARVFGPEFLAQAVPVLGDGPDGVAVRGVVARPALSRGSADGLALSVNGRPVSSRRLTQAVRVAFADYLPRTRFPVGVLHLAIDVGRVDPNVHPTKREIRIARESEVEDSVRLSVRRALLGAPQVADRPSDARGSRGGLSRPAGSVGGLAAERASLPPVAVPGGLSHDPTAALGRFGPRPPPRVVPGSPRHPRVALLGCLFDLYWVAEGEDDALLLVDQHAASERVLYERLLADGRLGRQELLEPVRLALSPRQRASLEVHAAALRDAGFGVEPFGSETYRVLSVPEFRGRRASPGRLASLLDELADGGRPTVPDGLRERAAATVACHSAIRAGDRVEAAEMGRVLEALRNLPEAAYSCPHGRPIVVRLPRARLDRWFLRSGA